MLNEWFFCNLNGFSTGNLRIYLKNVRIFEDEKESFAKICYSFQKNYFVNYYILYNINLLIFFVHLKKISMDQFGAREL